MNYSPRPSPHNAISIGEDGYLVYNLKSSQLHRLNPGASLIMELCDGNRSARQICQKLSPLLGNDSATCLQWIDDAVRQGLLVAQKIAGKEPIVVAKIFAKKASQLRDDGKILAALACQQQAIENEKDNAEYWLALGELAHILGRREDARNAYQQHLELRPANAEAAHILKALMDSPAPSRAPDDCIKQLYSRFAEFYESNMCGELDYEAPQRIDEILSAHFQKSGELDVLELGCGTGLSGKIIRPYARHLAGIDLSIEMVEKSKSTGLYDQLEVAEITSYLNSDVSNFDLIVACDTLIYFGDLTQVIAPAAELLHPQGHLLFTVERGEHTPYRLTDSGRYAHTQEHIRSVASQCSLQVVTTKEGFLRQEYGEPVTGIVTLLRKT